MSARKQIVSRKILLAVLLCIIGLVVTLARHSSDLPVVSSICLKQDIKQVITNSCEPVEMVSTPEARQKGFSGREPSSGGDAMLFVFDTPGTYCMWMKDMKFAVDIAWISSDNKVTTLLENISPNSYPKQYCNQGLYVLEVTVGRSRGLGIVPGNTLDITLMLK